MQLKFWPESGATPWKRSFTCKWTQLRTLMLIMPRSWWMDEKDVTNGWILQRAWVISDRGESREKNVMTHPVQRSVWDVKSSRFATLPVVPRLKSNSHFLTDKARKQRVKVCYFHQSWEQSLNHLPIFSFLASAEPCNRGNKLHSAHTL